MEVGGREDEIRARLGDIAGPEPGPAERALLARLLRSFVAKTPDGVDRLGALLRGGEPRTIRDHAHTLKGSAANLGADRFAAICAEVEQEARDGRLPDPDSPLGRLAAEQAQVLDLMARLAAEFGP